MIGEGGGDGEGLWGCMIEECRTENHSVYIYVCMYDHKNHIRTFFFLIYDCMYTAPMLMQLYFRG